MRWPETFITIGCLFNEEKEKEKGGGKKKAEMNEMVREQLYDLGCKSLFKFALVIWQRWDFSRNHINFTARR